MSLTFSQRKQTFLKIASTVISNRFCHMVASPNFLFSLQDIDGALHSDLRDVTGMALRLSREINPPHLEEIVHAATKLIYIIPGSVNSVIVLQMLNFIKTKDSPDAETEEWLNNGWKALRNMFGAAKLVLKPWENTGPTFERHIDHSLSEPHFGDIINNDFGHNGGLLTIQKSTMTPSIRLLSSFEKTQTPGTFARVHGVTGRYSLDDNAVDTDDWCRYVLEQLYGYTDAAITPDLCRAILEKHDITTGNVTKDELSMLHKIASDALSNSIIYNGDAELLPLCKKNSDNWRHIKMQTAQWQGREAFSFNADGFIGVAGWASTKNQQPLCQALCQWAEVVSSNRLHSTNLSQRGLNNEVL